MQRDVQVNEVNDVRIRKGMLDLDLPFVLNVSSKLRHAIREPLLLYGKERKKIRGQIWSFTTYSCMGIQKFIHVTVLIFH